MANEVLTAQAVTKARELYESLPATTILRGLTGYGLVVDKDDQEVIGEVSGAKGIWKPGYLLVVGGEKHGRRKLTAERVSAAAQQFVDNPLLAVLRSTSGLGLRLDDAGMVELVDINEATTQVTFELTHYGGRSIVPTLVTELGKVMVKEIEWRGGFAYQAPGNKPVQIGQPLVLTRFLGSQDYESEDHLRVVLEDLTNEANRLSLLHTDGTLPSAREEPSGRTRAFVAQELTGLVPGVELEEQPGFGYHVREGGVVEVSKGLYPQHVASEEAFAEAFEAFHKECHRVFALYCQPLTERQKQYLGKPVDKVYGLLTTPQLTWQKAREGGAIAFHPNAPRRENAVFPEDGWKPQIGKTHRVLCVRKGRGFTGYPAPPVYIERFAEKEGDPQTAVRQTVRVAFDGTEKVVGEAKIPLEEKRELRTGTYWSPKAEVVNGVWSIIETLTDYNCLMRQQVVDSFDKDVNGKSITKIDWRTAEQVPVPHERSFPAGRVWLERAGDAWGRQDDLENPDPSQVWKGWVIKVFGQDPDGKEAEASIRGEGGKALKWEEVPEDLRNSHLAEWPICACGQIRYETAKFDKCRLCRDHRPCSRCGKDTYFGEKKIAEGSPLICSNCESWLEQTAAVAAQVSLEHREAIAAEAQALLAGKIIEKEAGTLLAEVIARRTPEGWLRDSKLRNLRQLAPKTAIVTGDGYWGSRLGQAELERCAGLLGKTPEEAIWTIYLVVKQDAYRLDQPAPPRFEPRELESLAQRLDAGQPVLAYFVTESDHFVSEVEKAVTAVEAALVKLAQGLGVEPDDVPESDGRKALAEAKKALERADFAEAKKLAEESAQVVAVALEREAERQAKAAAGEILLDVRVPLAGHKSSRDPGKVWAIAPDGSVMSPEEEDQYHAFFGDLSAAVLIVRHYRSDYGYQYHEEWEVVHQPATVTEAQRQAVKNLEEDPEVHYYFKGRGTGWDLSREGKVVFSTPYHRDFYGEDREALDAMRAEFPVDISRYETEVEYPEVTDWDPEPAPITLVGPHPRRSPREKELWEEMAELQRQSNSIDQELGYGNRVVCKLADDTSRLSAELRSKGVRQFQGSGEFSGGVEFRAALEEEKWRHYSGINAIFSCRVYPDSEQQPQPGEVWILIVKFQITETREGVVLAANPRLRDDRAALKAKITRLEKELAAEQKREANFVEEPFDEEGNPMTAIAAALQKVGLG